MKFPVWEAELPQDLCKKYFPERMPFQKGYKKAEALFQGTALAAQIRNEIHRESLVLFGSLGQKVEVAGSFELLSAIGFGFRECKAQVYAFVITAEGRLRFCEAAAEVMHITMSDASKEILFAGEFFLCHEAGKYRMCVTNNSGSYRPNEERLQQAKQLFTELLGDCEVEALDMNDPRIKELTTRHRGDPAHMGHSIFYPERVEERTAAQIKSALVIMGRGHEVEGYAGPRSIPVAKHFPFQSPQTMTRQPQSVTRQLSHRRVRTWGSAPAGTADKSEVPVAGPPTTAPRRAQAKFTGTLSQSMSQSITAKHSAPSTASTRSTTPATRSTTPATPRSRNGYAHSIAPKGMYTYADPFASSQKPFSPPILS
jgi:hypothetical protein